MEYGIGFGGLNVGEIVLSFTKQSFPGKDLVLPKQPLYSLT